MKRIIFSACISLLLFSSCRDEPFVIRDEALLLDGSWQFALDSAGKGISAKFFSSDLPDIITLPATLDENNKGYPNLNRMETMRLSRELTYEGYAWYRREIEIPESWSDRHIHLVMERTKPTTVWIYTVKAGSCSDIMTAQVYDLSGMLSPGRHHLTILVDNGPESVPDGIKGSHAWTEHTQSNWNGILGRFCLEASAPVFISNIKIFTDIEKKTATAKIRITSSREGEARAELILKAESWNSDDDHRLPARKYPVSIKKGDNEYELTYKMNNFRSWSEFAPVLYKMTATLRGDDIDDNDAVDFGMRKLSARGTQFAINGITTFMRGKHDGCVFPLTGHPPMDVEAWRKVFRTAKEYNINFYRFHSWTPPEAAFIAADIEGIYMQPELPFWGGFRKTNSELNSFLMKEGDNILETYGNHASFVMFALGNELNGDLDVMRQFVDRFRAADNRRMYSFGTNNYLGFRGQVEGEDYYTGCRVGADRDTTFRTHIRASFSFADAWDGGYINGRYPSTVPDYAGAIAECTIPVMGTEVGQYQVYPDYDEIEKYTGVMKPWNLEVFRSRLEENGLSGQAKEFFRASGALSAICYKADIEMAMRTPGFGGFHLLDLQDFPGQGTALIGLLDAFMDSKGLVSPEEFGHFCNSVVPLAIFDKYCWSGDETFSGRIKVANYSDKEYKGQKVRCELKDSRDVVLGSSEFTADIEMGKLNDLGTFNIDLGSVRKAEKLTFSIMLEGTHYMNTYPVWVYPPADDPVVPGEIMIAERPGSAMFRHLESGGKVLLFPAHDEYEEMTVGGLFIPDYWNYRMFRGISERNGKPVSPGTMSVLTDPRHPVFNEWPTEFHTNWQWWPLIKNSRPFILDKTPPEYKPLVQVVDNIERNHKLGLLFEFRVGSGKLLVCMSDLRKVTGWPEGKQFYRSVLNYMSSPAFDPGQELSVKELSDLFASRASARKITGVDNISY
ncbi:MAG: beta-glycosidase [Bacteroidales bacterium]|nr:beta-glycosidase [Bacteroidales bacterium]